MEEAVHLTEMNGNRWTRDNHSSSWQPDYRIMRDAEGKHSSLPINWESGLPMGWAFFQRSTWRLKAPSPSLLLQGQPRSYFPEQRKHFLSISIAEVKREPSSLWKHWKPLHPQVLWQFLLKGDWQPRRLTEKELAEAAERLDTSGESNWPDISEFGMGSTAFLLID
jgi:hypothetical protein